MSTVHGSDEIARSPCLQIGGSKKRRAKLKGGNFMKKLIASLMAITLTVLLVLAVSANEESIDAMIRRMFEQSVKVTDRADVAAPASTSASKCTITVKVPCTYTAAIYGTHDSIDSYQGTFSVTGGTVDNPVANGHGHKGSLTFQYNDYEISTKDKWICKSSDGSDCKGNAGMHYRFYPNAYALYSGTLTCDK